MQKMHNIIETYNFGIKKTWLKTVLLEELVLGQCPLEGSCDRHDDHDFPRVLDSNFSSAEQESAKVILFPKYT